MFSLLVSALENNYAIPLAALIISLTAFIFGVVRSHSSTLNSIEQAMSDRIEDLTKQLDDAKVEIRELNRRCQYLEGRNTQLMSKLLKLENGHD